MSLEREAFAGLLRSPALVTGDIEAALRDITAVATRLLRVKRASVWRFDAARTKIECLCLYESDAANHSHGLELTKEQAPAYFAAALEERSIAAHDARTDPRTSEFRETYLEPLGITAMLDAPIVVRGELVGVLCCEHIGSSRRWSSEEELVAGTLADFVGMAMGAAAHAAQARELAVLHSGLERLVEERTRELRSAQENVKALFEASPLGLVLTRTTDQTVLLVNDDAAHLFDVEDKTKVRGLRAQDFWVHPEDRSTFLSLVKEHGEAKGLEVELVSVKGKAFWGAVSGRLIQFEGEPALLVGVNDITTKRVAEEALRKSEETLRLILEAAPIPLVLTGLDSAIVRYSNTRAADMFGTTLDAFVGQRAPNFYVDPAERQAFIDKLGADGRIDGFAARLKTVDGRSFWALLSARTMVLGGERVFAVGFTDLTEQKEIEEKLRALASLDGLTGAFNRRHFFDVAERSLAVGKRACAVMIDVDHFKAINDRHGHAVGDEALRIVTDLCRKECRATDIVARYGGEEFALLLPEADSRAARIVVERIRNAIAAASIPAASGSFTMTVSAGVAERLPKEGLEALLARADRALYEAKRAGRDRVSVAPTVL